MNNSHTEITGAEWNVMDCLWSSAPRTVMEIVHELSASVGWAKSTTTTMIKRMEAKGLIYAKDGGKAKLYYPAVRRTDAAAAETKSFLSRVYRGSVGLMVNAVAESGGLSQDEIDELYAILKKAEEKK